MEIEIRVPPMQMAEGDYIQDGLVYCGVCHAPKQCRVKLWGGRVMPCMCKCQEAAEKQRKADAEAKRKAEWLSERRRAAFNDGRMANWTFAMDDGKTPMLGKIKAFAENFEKFKERGKGLLLMGGTGTGKTFAAACLANAVLERGFSVRMTNFADVGNELMQTFDKADYMSELLGVDLLILDDLDVERETSYMAETVYNVVDGRYRVGKPMVITTNLSPKEMQAPGSIEKRRVYSRIFEGCIPIVIDGPDRRMKKPRENVDEFNRILRGE